MNKEGGEHLSCLMEGEINFQVPQHHLGLALSSLWNTLETFIYQSAPEGGHKGELDPDPVLIKTSSGKLNTYFLQFVIPPLHFIN